MLLKEDFFRRDTILVAQDLIGKIMCVNLYGKCLTGKVVETEAYLGPGDPGSHSFRGKTKRNATMFGPAGFSYVYQIYGMYFCYNVTTDQEHIPAAVLIRALEPVTGLETMSKNRRRKDVKDLLSGPGKLCQALGITKDVDGTSAIRGPVRFLLPDESTNLPIITTTRIGLNQGADLKLRFYLQNSPYISRK